MPSRSFMTAFLVLTTSIGGLYIFMATFGGAMDSMYFTFNNTTPLLALPMAWNTTAANALSQWQFFYRSVVAIMIALGVWVVRIAIVDMDYTRQG